MKFSLSLSLLCLFLGGFGVRFIDGDRGGRFESTAIALSGQRLIWGVAF